MNEWTYPKKSLKKRYVPANGTYNEQVVVRCHHQGRYDLTVKNCCGQVVLLRQIERQVPSEVIALSHRQ